MGVGLLAGLLGVGCASPVYEAGGRFHHRRHDYRIETPRGSGPAWERVQVEEAALAFRRLGPDTLSLVSRCGRPVASAQLMARHLMIGIPELTLVAAGPLSVAGHGGWTQTVEMTRDGMRFRIKTVTLVVGECSFDWILASAGPFGPAESAFDAWWASFELGDRQREEVGS